MKNSETIHVDLQKIEGLPKKRIEKLIRVGKACSFFYKENFYLLKKYSRMIKYLSYRFFVLSCKRLPLLFEFNILNEFKDSIISFISSNEC